MSAGEIKSKIGSYVMDIGVDDVGFANVADYPSTESLKIETILPEAKSIVVMVFKETSNCESSNNSIVMNGRMDLSVFARSCIYQTTRFLEREFGVRAMSLPLSYSLDINETSKDPIVDVSLQKAAYAAGLAYFGSDNHIIHPSLGSHIAFAAILTELDLPSDPLTTEILSDACNIGD